MSLKVCKAGIHIAFLYQKNIMKKLEEIRKEYILRVLSDTCWDIKKASKILKVSEKYLKKEIQKIEHQKDGIPDRS